MDWTPIIVALIGAVAAWLGKLALAYIKPWLEERRLLNVAAAVVNAVEVLYRDLNGKDKLQKAIERINELGLQMDEDLVRGAIEAAWLKMNSEQVVAGIKDKPPDGE